MRTCQTDGCGRPHYAKGLCRSCWKKARYYALSLEERQALGLRNRSRLDKAHHQAYMAQYYRDHPEKWREYWARQATTKRETARRRYQTDPEYREKILEQGRVWRAANPDKVRAQTRRYRSQDPAKTKARAARAQWTRRSLKKATLAAPFTEAQLKDRLSMFAGCWLCGGDATEIDHVKPLSKGGAHMLANLRPICRSCNRKKRDLWPVPVRLISR